MFLSFFSTRKAARLFAGHANFGAGFKTLFKTGWPAATLTFTVSN
jgi:hypothetical protein